MNSEQPLIIGLLGALTVSIIANLITYTFFTFMNSEGVTVFSRGNLNVKHVWRAESKTPAGIVVDELTITQQIFGLIAGIVDARIDGKAYKLNFRGRFIKSDLVRYWFWPSTSVIEYGTGMFQIHPTGRTGYGHAVIYGVSTLLPPSAENATNSDPVIYSTEYKIVRE